MGLISITANTARISTGSALIGKKYSAAKKIVFQITLAIFFSITLAFTPKAFALDSTVLLGDNTIGDKTDTNELGVGEAFPIAAAATGTINTMNVYLGPKSTVQKLTIGIYTDRRGHPYKLLGQGTSASLTPDKWNAIAITDVNVITGAPYWIAILGTNGGTMDFRDKTSTTCRNESSYQKGLTALPASWRTASLWNGCPLSAYGTGGPSTLSATTGTLSVPSGVSFGNVNVGANGTKTVTLKNSGTASVSISSATVNGAGFSISGLTTPLTLTAGQSVSFSAGFAPTVSGSVTGSVTLASNASNPSAYIPFTGTGVDVVVTPTLVLSATPTNTSFANVQTGSNSTLPVILKNVGTGSVTISNATVTGTEFSIGGLTLPLTLTAGQSTSFNVTFAPTTTGTFTGNVAIDSNASAGTINEALSGAGVNTHLVALKWVSSTSSNVVGYHVYRGTHAGGPYTKIDSQTVASTSFNDDTVDPGQAYYYVTTAVDDKNTESDFSNESQAGVPVP